MSFDIGGNSGHAFPFERIGDSVTGKIESIEEVQQTNLEDGKPAFWDGGQPKMMYRVTLQTDLRDEQDDDGKRAVYLRGSRKPDSKSSLSAVLVAVRQATGKTSLDPGATLTLAYVGEGTAAKRGHNPPKQYEARYVAPSTDLGAPQPQYAAQAQPPF